MQKYQWITLCGLVLLKLGPIQLNIGLRMVPVLHMTLAQKPQTALSEIRRQALPMRQLRRQLGPTAIVLFR